MKRLLAIGGFLSIFLFSAFSLSAQKLKDKRMQFKYVQLPKDKLPDDYTTYSVQVVGGGLYTAGYSASSMANKITMHGFKRMGGAGDDYGHLRIRVHTGYVSTGQADLEKNVSKKKDKDGKETTTTTYYYSIPLSVDTYYEVFDPNGTILTSGNLPFSEDKKTKSYSSATTLRKEYTNLKKGLRTEFAKNAVNKIIVAANDAIGSKYDFKNKYDSHELYWIKKYEEEDRWEKYVDETEEIFKAADYTTSSEELRESLSKMLDFWKKYADATRKDDKKLARVYEAANYNIALVSYYLDDFETAKKHANNVIAAEGKHSKSKALLAKIEKNQALMELHGVTTLHYKRDMDNALPPSKVAELEAIKEELEEGNESLAGTIMMNGAEVKGSFHQENDSGDIKFGPDGNVKFMTEDAGELKEIDLTTSEISGFNIGERKFAKMMFSPCAKGREEAKHHILEELYSSSKIALYMYYPTTGSIADEKPEFAFKKENDVEPTSLMDTQFLLWNKGLANYFAECGDLAEMATGGGIELNKDDLIKAARIYSELCN